MTRNRRCRATLVAATITVAVCTGVFLCFAFSIRNAPPGTITHDIAKVTSPAHAQWNENRSWTISEISVHTQVDSPCREIGFEAVNTTEGAPRDVSYIYTICSEDASLVDNAAGVGDFLSPHAEIDLSMTPQTSRRGDTANFAVIRDNSEPSESWIPAAGLSVIASLIVLWCLCALAGRRPTAIELGIASALLPVSRRPGWREYVVEVWDNAGSARNCRRQMRSIVAGFPVAVAVAWTMEARRSFPVRRR